MAGDVIDQARERREDTDVVCIVGAQLEAVSLGNDERDFEDVDRIETEPFAVQRRLRVDRLGRDIQVERINHERSNLPLQIGLDRSHVPGAWWCACASAGQWLEQVNPERNAGCEGSSLAKHPVRLGCLATPDTVTMGPATPRTALMPIVDTTDRETDLVHLPHGPLTAYYGDGDAQARQRFIHRAFDDTAADYDRLEKILGLGTGSWYRRQALERAGLKGGMQVVDVGMGTGLVSREILRITGEPERLIGVDPSPGMMAQADLPAGVRCVEGTAERMPLPDASADFIVMGYALRHIGDLAAAFAEFRRVLKPGGRVLVLEISKPRGALGTLLLKAYMRGVVPLLARLISKQPGTPLLWRYYWDTIEACAPPEAVMRTLSGVGLHDVRREVALGMFSEYSARR
jgi:demethylmenaquinone methyltransferase / 2-methoxy-6-polyprenyl-1,4-benzoquinol methylase